MQTCKHSESSLPRYKYTLCQQIEHHAISLTTRCSLLECLCSNYNIDDDSIVDATEYEVSVDSGEAMDDVSVAFTTARRDSAA